MGSTDPSGRVAARHQAASRHVPACLGRRMCSLSASPATEPIQRATAGHADLAPRKRDTHRAARPCGPGRPRARAHRRRIIMFSEARHLMQLSTVRGRGPRWRCPRSVAARRRLVSACCARYHGRAPPRPDLERLRGRDTRIHNARRLDRRRSRSKCCRPARRRQRWTFIATHRRRASDICRRGADRQPCHRAGPCAADRRPPDPLAASPPAQCDVASFDREFRVDPDR